ncbi:prenyltransferase [Ottowia testudinis]|uniref:Prenyltransferase n=1 Tax=Ottowia testudinis TaxID=2816950 RepID=A0A975H2S6_9BURK|nr:prenyltransferase [Ottowia testudinis]QTD45079.1 prenyltransferase [Ottowia testudinis]
MPALSPSLSWRQRAALHWRMTRPGFLLITLTACLLGLATAATAGAVRPATAVLTLLLACMAHAGANVLNDFHDALNGADAANDGAMFPFSGGSRLIQQGVVSVPHTARWAAWLLLPLIPAGLLLAWHGGPGLLAVGAAGLGLAWAYSAPPLRLMSRGLGELAVAAAWALVVVGADFVQRGHFAVLPAALGAALGLLVACILLINGVPDAAADARVGKRTLAVRLGGHGAARLYGVLTLLAQGVVVTAVWTGVAPRAALAGLLALPLSLAAAALLGRHAAAPTRLKPAMALSIAAANVQGLAMAAGLGLAAALA